MAEPQKHKQMAMFEMEPKPEDENPAKKKARKNTELPLPGTKVFLKMG